MLQWKKILCSHTMLPYHNKTHTLTFKFHVIIIMIMWRIIRILVINESLIKFNYFILSVFQNGASNLAKSLILSWRNSNSFTLSWDEHAKLVCSSQLYNKLYTMKKLCLLKIRKSYLHDVSNDVIYNGGLVSPFLSTLFKNWTWLQTVSENGRIYGLIMQKTSKQFLCSKTRADWYIIYKWQSFRFVHLKFFRETSCMCNDSGSVSYRGWW